MTVQNQKEIANKVYRMLRLADPDCLLAGGAPRDWYFGNEANDLDFYFCSTASTMRTTGNQLKSLGFEGVKHISDPYTSELYKCMEGLVRIWECVVDGMKVQLIQLAEPKYRWKVVDNMDVSICKVYYVPDTQTVKLHKDFKLTIVSNIMFLKDGYEWSHKHAVKMAERFQNFSRGTRETAIQRVLNQTLENV